MANNIYETVVTDVAATETKEIYSLNIYAFKSAKLLVSILDETAEKVSAFETLISYKKQPSLAALDTTGSPIGDSMSYTFNVELVLAVEPTENDRIVLKLLNSGANTVKAYVGEIERVE